MREMPSVMAARWVGRNSGLYFCRLKTELLHQIKLARVGVITISNAVFSLTI